MVERTVQGIRGTIGPIVAGAAAIGLTYGLVDAIVGVLVSGERPLGALVAASNHEHGWTRLAAFLLAGAIGVFAYAAVRRLQHSRAGLESAEARYRTLSRAAGEGKERYRTLVELSPDAIIVYQEDRFVFVNPAAVTLFGAASSADFLGMRTTDLVHPSVLPLTESRKRQILEGRELETIEITLVRLDGSAFRAEVNGRSLLFEGRPAIQAVIRDITARNGAASALRRSEERFARIFHASPGMLGIIDGSDERYVDVNQTWLSVMGYEREEVIGKSQSELGVWADPDQHERANRLLREHGSIRDLEIKYRTKNGETIDLLVAVDRLEFAGEERTLGVGLDITERKRAEAVLRATEARLSAVIASAPMIIWAVDQDGVVTLSEGKGLEMIGLKPGELVGRSMPALRRILPGEEDNLPRALAGERFSGIIAVGDAVFESFYHPVLDDDGEIEGVIGVDVDIAGRRRAEAALRESEQRILGIMDNVEEGIITIDEAGLIESLNPAAETIFGYSSGEAIGRNVSTLMPRGERGRHDGHIRNYLRSGEGRILGVGARQVRGLRKDGGTVPLELTVSEMSLAGRRLFIGIVRDISRRLATDEQLKQAQKMEPMGQLTGGIAHDFNNMLTVILGNIELLEGRLSGDGNLLGLARAAKDGAFRAAELTQRLLAFARKQPLEPQAIDLDALIGDVAELLRRTLGAPIEVEIRTASDSWPALADPIQTENALLNLAINARDAMPEGGRLTIETRNVPCAAPGEQRTRPAPGESVVLAVHDTGCGMAPDTVAHAFEPFFTTKGPEEGSGLGLSMVCGFARQSGGHAVIHSVLGRGTTVEIHLPRADRHVAHAAEPEVHPNPGGGETILVVEDDASVRTFTVRALKALGYNTLEADDASEALGMLGTSPGIALVLSDVVLPRGISGIELCHDIRRRRPGVKVLLTSGYAEEALARHGSVTEGVRLIKKPYRRGALASEIRGALDQD